MRYFRFQVIDREIWEAIIYPGWMFYNEKDHENCLSPLSLHENMNILIIPKDREDWMCWSRCFIHLNAEKIEAIPATHDQVARVHQPQLIKAIEEVCKQGPGIIDHAPTYVTQTSYQDALLAAGGVIACTRAVLNGDAKNAFAIVRPPGHHAEPDRSMGFCIFNNIAIAAREALANGMERVMVIDYDAHHGNGTQAACMDDERFGFISTHQWGIYPGTGWIDDAPHAKGRLVNVPLHSFAGDEVFARVADEIFKPVVEKFRPQMLFISAGFDAHWSDPLTSLGLSTQGFFNISKKLVDLADEYCQWTRSSLYWKAAMTRTTSPTGRRLSSTH